MYIEPLIIKTDTHCHTVASTHAYSTVLEMAQYASKKGLEGIIITDHCHAIPDGAHPWHFGNMNCFPPYIEGVRVFHGAEANIIDLDGNIDLDVKYQQDLDWVIASIHDPCLKPGSIEQHTNAYLKLSENPNIDVIGHCGTEDYRFDYERVIPVFKERGKLIEINSHSFECRAGAHENCRQIALICKKYNVPIVVSSDAHICFSVGDFAYSLDMLEDIDFPQELIINRRLETLADWISKKRQRAAL